MVDVGYVAENFRFSLFQMSGAEALFLLVENCSWDHLRDRHSFAETLLLCMGHFFPAQQPSQNSFDHDRARAHLKIWDQYVGCSWRERFDSRCEDLRQTIETIGLSRSIVSAIIVYRLFVFFQFFSN
jgi:hypothetical protein